MASRQPWDEYMTSWSGTSTSMAPAGPRQPLQERGLGHGQDPVHHAAMNTPQDAGLPRGLGPYPQPHGSRMPASAPPTTHPAWPPGSAPPGYPPRIQSCQFCRRRKIKCDKTIPSCMNCLKGKSTCVYPKRKGRVKNAVGKVGEGLSGREEQLLRKIRSLERVVGALQSGKDVDEAEEEGEGRGTLAPVGKQAGGEEGGAENLSDPLGKLVIGQPYLGDEFWRSNELKDILGESSDDMESDDEELAMPAYSPQGTDFIFGVGPVLEDLFVFHPPISQVLHYWHVYLENCECLLRLIHVPSFTPIIQNAVLNNLQSLHKSDELLMFCFYFAAITSLTDEEVIRQFGEERGALLPKYELGIKYGLMRGRLLHTQDLKVLQALVLFLTCIPNIDPAVSAVVWNMTGLALRIAQSMSVDRDGEILKLSPLETELRRRLWYHLLFLDIRSAEARGCLSTVLQYDTRLPTNLNDSDLTPDTTEYAKPRTGLTDMTVPLKRLEASRLGRRLQATGFRDAMLSPPMKRKLIERVQQELQDKYIQYCHGAGSLYEYSAKVATMITTRANLAVYADKIAAAPQAEKDWLFRICIEIMEFYHELNTSAHSARKWSWLLTIHVQWHAVAFALKELCERSPSEDTQRAWDIIDKSAKEWKPPPDEKGALVYESVKKLLSKAQRRREHLARTSAENSTSPESMDSSQTTATGSSTGPRAGKPASSNPTPPMNSANQQQIPPHMPPQARIPHVEQVPYDYYFEFSDPALAAAFHAGPSAFQPDAQFQPGVETSFQDHYLPSYDPQMPMHPHPGGNTGLPKWYFGPNPAAAGQRGNMMPGGPMQMQMQMPMPMPMPMQAHAQPQPQLQAQTQLQTHNRPYDEYDMGMGTDMSGRRNPG